MLGERLSYIWRDIFWWWTKIFIGPPLRWFFHGQSEGKKPFPEKGQAAFLFANHTHAVDPFMIADFINRPIRYVISDEYFRYKFTRILLNWIKGIPKTKNVPDSVTMRMILKAIKRGEIIGIFPEGARNWDGETIPLSETIPRLVKKLKIPVICIRQRGSYLSWPRWTNQPRRNRIIFSFSYLFENPEDVPEDASEIKRLIENELIYCELEDPEVTRLVFDIPRVAEHLELRLWLCPHCRRFFTLQSRERYLSCNNCGARWKFIGNGTFRLKRMGESPSPDARHFKRYIDWAHWNDEETLNIFSLMKKNGEKLLVKIPARMWAAPTETMRNRAFSSNGDGTAVLTDNFHLVFKAKNGKVLLEAPLKDMKGANVAWNQKFEFFLPGMAYRFTFFGQSAYFWHFLTKKLNHNGGGAVRINLGT